VPSATFARGPTAIIGLSVYAGAYIAEIVRGAIESVPRGQGEAASALGMGYLLRYRYVVLPQAMKVAVPPSIGFLISLVKASSLVSVINYVELTKAGAIVSNLNQEPLVTFLVVAALYFALSYPIALFGRWYERRLV
jgi:polar amino acid transport system permease protein